MIIQLVQQGYNKVKNLLFSPPQPEPTPAGPPNNERKRKFPHQQIAAELTDDEESNQPFLISFKKKKLDLHQPTPTQQQGPPFSFPAARDFRQPGEKKFFETNYNLTANSTYPYYPNLMALQNRMEKNKKIHVTRNSGLSPRIKGLEQQPWEFKFKNSKPVTPYDKDDMKKKFVPPKKFELITIMDSDVEDDDTEDPDFEILNGKEKEKGKLKTIKGKKPGASDMFKKYPLIQSPGNKITKQRKKLPITYSTWAKWFPEKAANLFRVDTKRPEEKNCYLELINASLSMHNSIANHLPLIKSSISNEDVNWNKICGSSSSSSRRSTPKNQNFESTFHLYSTRINDNHDPQQTGYERKKLISSHLSSSLIKDILKDNEYTRTRWDPTNASTPYPGLPPQPEVINLEKDVEEKTKISTSTHDRTETEEDKKSNNNDDEISILHEKITINYKKPCSLELEQSFTHLTNKKWAEDRRKSFTENQKERERKISEERRNIEILKSESTIEKDLDERLRRKLTLTGVIELEDQQLPEITEEMAITIQKATSGGSVNEVLNTLFNIDITRADIKTLEPCKWLNDNVINAYMEMISHRSKGDGYRSVYPFTTFFYPKLLKEGYSNILKRWTRKVDIFSYKLLVFPIHLGLHWCLAVADLESKSLKYYDSLGGRNDQCLRALINYLRSEMNERKQKALDVSEWHLENVQGIPQQENGSDCGMFSCKFAEYLSRGADISGVRQEDMNYFRQRLVYELVKNELIHP